MIADVFPIGSIDEEGKVIHDDRYDPRGEPLVGISARIENVAEACKITAPRSKVVLVDAASPITDLGKFDQITERQNLIIFAESGDDEKLRQLYDRGCKFWPVFCSPTWSLLAGQLWGLENVTAAVSLAHLCVLRPMSLCARQSRSPA